MNIMEREGELHVLTLKVICDDVKGLLTSPTSFQELGIFIIYMQAFKRELCLELPP
jgi:hypothetical protein